MRLFRHVTALSYGLNPSEYDDEPPPLVPPVLQLPAPVQQAAKRGIGAMIGKFALAGLLGAAGGGLTTLGLTHFFPAPPPQYQLEAEWKFDATSGKGLELGKIRQLPPPPK
jgi:hypothetical protein